MKKSLFILLSAAVLLLTACTSTGQTADSKGKENSSAKGETGGSYTQISQEEAKDMMAKDDGHVIVDVRRLDEYASGHIPGAICIPNESIGKEQPEELPDPDQIILIYCRSGNRSKQASQKLYDMGYGNIYEFGGIIDWDGEVVTGESAEEENTEGTQK